MTNVSCNFNSYLFYKMISEILEQVKNNINKINIYHVFFENGR